jgi:aquaporin Z
MQRALVIEAVGTGVLVIIIAMASVNAGVMAPLAIGLGLAALVYMGGPVSGAHYNPAVSLCLAMTRALPMERLGPYAAAQCVGAIVGASVACAMTGEAVVPAPGVDVAWWRALITEAVFTFMLCIVIIGAAVAPASKGRGYFGLAIGLTILAAALAGGPISGGVYNPGVALGLAALGLSRGIDASHVWLYLIGPVIGALAATLLSPAIVGEAGKDPQ